MRARSKMNQTTAMMTHQPPLCLTLGKRRGSTEEVDSAGRGKGSLCEEKKKKKNDEREIERVLLALMRKYRRIQVTRWWGEGGEGEWRVKGKVSSITNFNLFSPFPPGSLVSLQVTAACLNYLPLAHKLNRAYSESERQRGRKEQRERGRLYEKSVHGHINAIPLSIPPFPQPRPG